jgi:hypothetical protein
MGYFDQSGVGGIGLFDQGQQPDPFSMPGLVNSDGNAIQNLATTPWSDLGAYGKMGVIGAGAGAFSSLANIYAGFKALKLQKNQFKFQKQAWNKNYNNQVKDYQNRLTDRWSARSNSAAARGGSFASMGNYVGSRALTGQPTGQI